MTNFLVKISTAVKSWISGKSITVRLSGRINLDNNPKQLIENLNPLFQITSKTDNGVIFDLSDVEFIYPSALLLIFSFRETIDTNFQILVKEGSEIHEYLLYCGLGDIFSIPTFPSNIRKTITDSSKVYKIKKGQELRHTPQIAQDLIDMLKTEQPLSPQVESVAIDSIEEILRNIVQHSHFSNYYLLAQTYPKSKRIRLAVYDNGIGIKSHLMQIPYEKTHPEFRTHISMELYEKMSRSTAEISIEQAARYMVSGTNYKNNSGAGLDFLISDLSIPTDGIVTILSEDGLVRWEKGKIVEKLSLPQKIKGTLVSVTFNCDPGSLLKFQKERI